MPLRLLPFQSFGKPTVSFHAIYEYLEEYATHLGPSAIGESYPLYSVAFCPQCASPHPVMSTSHMLNLRCSSKQPSTPCVLHTHLFMLLVKRHSKRAERKKQSQVEEKIWLPSSVSHLPVRIRMAQLTVGTSKIRGGTTGQNTRGHCPSKYQARLPRPIDRLLFLTASH